MFCHGPPGCGATARGAPGPVEMATQPPAYRATVGSADAAVGQHRLGAQDPVV